VTDETVLVDTVTIAAPVSVLLLEAPTVDGQMWTVKDSTGSAGTYNITVSSVSSDINIDGATTFVLNNAYQSASFVWSSAEGQYYLVDEANISIPTPTSFTWSAISTNQSAVSNNGYIVSAAPFSNTTLTLPTSSSLGDVIRVASVCSSGSYFIIAQNASQSIVFGSSVTATGTGGSITNTLYGDTIEMVCITANLKWLVLSSVGNFTIVS